MLIELLADEGTVILRCDESTPPIQRDQFGQALRRASETHQVAIFDADGENLSADMLDLMAGLDGKAHP